jgi:flavin-dependent thymidylate synthase
MEPSDLTNDEAGGPGVDARPPSSLAKWADEAMFKAEEMPEDALEGPKVHLLWMTPDPLGAAAAMNAMYVGKVKRSLADVTRQEREALLADMMATALKAPFESIKLHFLIEGVTRGFTHQLVRQRTAVYAQESTRFAVFGDGTPLPVGLPPSLHGTEPLGTGRNMALGAEDDSETYARNLWDQAVDHVEQAYIHMVDAGMPAEDARGILPTNLLTRIHYVTDLRNLHAHAGLRLSTQAQFEWRTVWAGIINAIRNYNPYADSVIQLEGWSQKSVAGLNWLYEGERWQYEAISNIFRPVCYYTGKCEFMATADRACSVRDRVQANHAVGRPSSEWHLPYRNSSASGGHLVEIDPIDPKEWLGNPAAARRAPGASA